MGPLVIKAAAQDLRYHPRVSLSEGLAELVDHLSTQAI
jgi:nucleoside-diphosphate-sugar epimerase